MTDKLQDTQEEEVVSLASGFDNEVDPFSIEQPVAPYSGLNAIAEEADIAFWDLFERSPYQRS